MVRFFNCFWIAGVICCAASSVAANLAAQSEPSEAQLEKALDVMDKSSTSSWNGPAQGDARSANQMPPDIVQRQALSGVSSAPQMFGHPQSLPPPGMSNPFTLQNALRIMLGGSSPTSAGAGASGNDSENLQTALDQKQQAIDACNSISGERDKGVKEGLASQAQDHANAARYAADALYNASNNSKSPEVHNMASRARNAANEAQSFADRARSKADGGGW